MTKLDWLALASAVSVALAVPAAAKDEPGLAANGPWTLDYDIDSCALRRVFGEGDNQVYLEFRRFGPNRSLQTVVASNRMRAENPARFKFRFAPIEPEWNDVGWAPTLKMADGFDGVIFSSSLMTFPEGHDRNTPQEWAPYLRIADEREAERQFAARAENFVIRGAFRKEIALHLGSMEKPIAALNECIDDLMTHWDIDVEAHKTLTRPATPIDFAAAARMVGYPPKMARQSMPGTVNVRLSIDETGRITSCRIQMPLSDPEFEESSCADIQHAFEFEPALDKDGKPIPSYWITRVVFAIN